MEYTGAPYISAISSLKTGSDLSYVICTKDAGTPIKSYGPELIVLPLLRTESDFPPETTKTWAPLLTMLLDWMSRATTIVIGPGLGRDPIVHHMAKEVVYHARSKSIPLLFDGDGLWAVENDPSLVKGYPLAVLTPNVNEYNRLCEKVLKKEAKGSNPEESVIELAKSLGNVTIVRKGEKDIISNGHSVLTCDIPGGPRRVGGQGDVLAGTIGCFVSWANLSKESKNPQPLSEPSNLMNAAYCGCALTKLCSKKAFEEKGRSMVAADLVQFIGPTFARYFEKSMEY
jgi:ATP-dependent NAD(P)H-hydrate dehydratase